MVNEPVVGFSVSFFFHLDGVSYYIYSSRFRVLLELFHVSYCLVFFFSCILHCTSVSSSFNFVIYVYVPLFITFLFWVA